MTVTYPSNHLEGCLCYKCRCKKWEDDGKTRWDCCTENEVAAFWGRVQGIRQIWHHTDDNDMEATNELFVDLLNEIEDFLGIPQGN